MLCISAQSTCFFKSRGKGVLSNESMRNVTEAEDNVMFYLTVYGCLAAGNSIFTLFRAFLYAYGGIRAAQVLHKTVLASILKVSLSRTLLNNSPIVFCADIVSLVRDCQHCCYMHPVWFFNLFPQAPIGLFDRTPIGRIVNRFSSDMYSIDDALPFILNILLAQMFGILGSVAITCYGLPWFSFLLIPLVTVYYFVQVRFKHWSLDVAFSKSVYFV